jgi:hypothetical protein
MILAVISEVREKLRKGSSEMDSALVRYFMSCLLEVMQPPFSLPFVRAIGGMLMERPCMDTLTSPLFDASKKIQLSNLITQFDKSLATSSVGKMEGVESLLIALRSTYSITP